MNNSIIELLNLTGDGLEVIDQESCADQFIITLCKSERMTVCPICGCPMHSMIIPVRFYHIVA